MRRLTNWFEVLPFRYGMVLLAGAVLVPALLVGGLLMSGGGSEKVPASARPQRQQPRTQVEAAVPSPPTWGAYVPPRRVKASRPPVQRRSAPTSTHRKKPGSHPSVTATCPASLKRWPWMWELCKHQNHS